MYMIAEVSQYVAVASFAEAWIEICYKVRRIVLLLSPPSRRRGLKSTGLHVNIKCNVSPPSRRRGLKFFLFTQAFYGCGRLLRGGVD